MTDWSPQVRRRLHAVVWLLAALHMVPYALNPPTGADLRDYFWPAWTFTRHAILSGHFPLWNPYMGCGVPWNSNFQSALYYPVNLLLYLAPFERVLSLYFVVTMGLNGSSALFMLESAGFEPIPSLAGAVCWQWTGFYMMYQIILAYAATLSWIPALTGCLLRAQRSERPVPWIMAGSACLACLWLAGSPHFAYIAILSQAFWVDWRRPRAALTVFTVGTLLAAVQLVPAADFVAHSSRAAMSSTFNLSFTYSVERLPTLIGMEFYRLWRGDAVSTVDFETYFGLVPTILALLALRSRSTWQLPAARRSVLLLVGGLVLAVGATTPVYPCLLKVLPGLSLFRAPSRFILWSAVGVSVLAAQGMRLCPRRWQTLTVLIVVLDLAWLSTPYLAQGHYRVPPGLQELAEDPEPYRLQLDTFDDVNLGQIIHHANVSMYDPTAPHTYVEYLIFNDLQAVPDPSWYERANNNSNAVFPQRLDTPLYRLMNVRWRMVDGRPVRTPQPMPHFFTIGTQRVIPGFDDTLTAMKTFDPGQEVLLDRAAPATQSGGDAYVTLTEYDCNGWTAEVRTDKPTLLVASELYFADWHAEVDGQETPIYRADALFRAVHLQPGTHRVTMRYAPASFGYGLAISILTLIGCTITLWRK